LHKIPSDLVLNIDETAVLFVPQVNRTRVEKGTKRIRCVGIGKDKAQITATIGITEDGKVLPPQLIIAGKTKKS